MSLGEFSMMVVIIGCALFIAVVVKTGLSEAGII